MEVAMLCKASTGTDSGGLIINFHRNKNISKI